MKLNCTQTCMLILFTRSWASHDGFVAWWPDYTERYLPDRYFALKKSKLEYTGPNPNAFSPIIRGFITISGRLTPVVPDMAPCKVKVTAKIDGRYPVDFFIDYLYPENAVLLSSEGFLALALADCGTTTHWVRTYLLVLVSKPSVINGYTRAGFAYVDFPTTGNRREFWGHIPPREIDLY